MHGKTWWRMIYFVNFVVIGQNKNVLPISLDLWMTFFSFFFNTVCVCVSASADLALAELE